jgi:Flp pilus assembly pilin Flp
MEADLPPFATGGPNREGDQMLYASFILSRVIVGVRGIAARYTGERGQDLIEYALLGGIIAAAIAGVTAGVMTGALSSMAHGIANCIDFNKATVCNP